MRVCPGGIHTTNVSRSAQGVWWPPDPPKQRNSNLVDVGGDGAGDIVLDGGEECGLRVVEGLAPDGPLRDELLGRHQRGQRVPPALVHEHESVLQLVRSGTFVCKFPKKGVTGAIRKGSSQHRVTLTSAMYFFSARRKP